MYVRDWVLVLVLLFMFGLVASKAGDYDTCRREDAPMLAWLLVNFASMLMFRVLHFLTHYAWNSPDPRSWQARRLPSLLVALQLWGLLPFEVAWCALGCVWYNRHHSCLPQAMSGWSFIIWIALGLLFVLQQVLLSLSVLLSRVRRPHSPHVEPRSCRAWTDALCNLHNHVLERLQLMELQQMGALPAAAAAAQASGLRAARSLTSLADD